MSDTAIMNAYEGPPKQERSKNGFWMKIAAWLLATLITVIAFVAQVHGFNRIDDQQKEIDKVKETLPRLDERTKAMKDQMDRIERKLDQR